MDHKTLYDIAKAKYEGNGFRIKDGLDISVFDHEESGGVQINCYDGWGTSLNLVVRPKDRVSYYWSIMVNHLSEGKGVGRRLFQVAEQICRELGIDFIVHTTILQPGFVEKMGNQKLLESDKARLADRLQGIEFDEKYIPYYKILS